MRRRLFRQSTTSAMEANQHPTRRKLVYLRDRAGLPRPRRPRGAARPPSPTDRDLLAEASWLGRALMAVAGGAALLWALRIDAGATVPAAGPAGGVAASAAVRLLLVAVAANATVRILRDPAGAAVNVAVAAGAVGLFSADGLARLVLGGDLSEPTLSVRGEILAHAAGVAVAVWAASWAWRTGQRGREPLDG